MYTIYDHIIDGHQMTEEEAIDYANGICPDWETSESEALPKYHQYLATENGVDVYYDFGADYYFYVEVAA